MVPKLKINFWNLVGYINLDTKIKKLILNQILLKDSVHNFSKKLSISDVSLGHFLNNKKSFIRIVNLIEVVSQLGISKHVIEENITEYKDTSSKDPFSIKFPYVLSPLDMRIGGVLIGDGNIHKTNGAIRWVQKDPSPLRNLIKLQLGDNVSLSIKNNQITIPAFFRKVLCYSSNLDLGQLNSEKFIEWSLRLPEDYKLSLLLAIIEDEGNIDSKNFGVIKIRMSSKEKIAMIKELCDDLDYKTSEIVSYKNNGPFGANTMYGINILSDGIKKFGYDLLKLKGKYCGLIGFWKKEKEFIKRWKACISEKAEKNREGKEIHKEIIKLFLEYKILSPLKISKLLEINYDRIYDLIKNMHKRGEVIRISKGTYKLKKQSIKIV